MFIFTQKIKTLINIPQTYLWLDLGTFVFPGDSDCKESAFNGGDLGSIPGLRRSPREGNGKSLLFPCLENSMDRGYSWTWLRPTFSLFHLCLNLSESLETTKLVCGTQRLTTCFWILCAPLILSILWGNFIVSLRCRAVKCVDSLLIQRHWSKTKQIMDAFYAITMWNDWGSFISESPDPILCCYRGSTKNFLKN